MVHMVILEIFTKLAIYNLNDEKLDEKINLWIKQINTLDSNTT